MDTRRYTTWAGLALAALTLSVAAGAVLVALPSLALAGPADERLLQVAHPGPTAIAGLIVVVLAATAIVRLRARLRPAPVLRITIPAPRKAPPGQRVN